jgi:hypothetical protein
MPTLSQGNIFTAVADHRADLAVIFGHSGFNTMHESWQAFSESVPSLSKIRDPFFEIAGKAHPISDGQWLWFVAERENHGMSDNQLMAALESAIAWAAATGVKSIVINGIADVVSDRVSDDRRASFLIQYATEQEDAIGVSVELISLNDVFVRNQQTLGD